MGNEPLEANAKGQNAKGRKVSRRQNAKGQKVNRQRNAKGWKVNRRRNMKGRISATVWISATKMGLSATEWAYRQPSRMVIGVGCRSHHEGFATIGFRFGFGPSQMVISDGLGSYQRRCGKLSVTVWVLIGDGLGVISD